jgi:hypothetical protein
MYGNITIKSFVHKYILIHKEREKKRAMEDRLNKAKRKGQELKRTKYQ